MSGSTKLEPDRPHGVQASQSVIGQQVLGPDESRAADLQRSTSRDPRSGSTPYTRSRNKVTYRAGRHTDGPTKRVPKRTNKRRCLHDRDSPGRWKPWRNRRPLRRRKIIGRRHHQSGSAQYRPSEPASDRRSRGASTVFVYNKAKLQSEQCRTSIVDLRPPKGNGMAAGAGYGPKGRDIPSHRSALLSFKGERRQPKAAGMKPMTVILQRQQSRP